MKKIFFDAEFLFALLAVVVVVKAVHVQIPKNVHYLNSNYFWAKFLPHFYARICVAEYVFVVVVVVEVSSTQPHLFSIGSNF